jgi:formylglycine-generating enzyme
MKSHLVALAVTVVLVLAVGSAQADVFNMGGTRDPVTGTWTGLASLDFVTVGDPGNAGYIPFSAENPTAALWSVGYTYNIGKYEVTAGQYTEFLNAKAKSDPYGLYGPAMAYDGYYGYGNYGGFCGCNITQSGTPGDYTYSVAAERANRPVNCSFWDACRFTNWLCNGQGDGDTETGAYTLNGYTGQDGRTIKRNPGTQWFLPNEDEWYKAAYYKGGSTNAGYWKYPTKSDSAPGCDLADASGNNANYKFYFNPFPIDSPYYTTTVGQFHNSAGPYGTFDQGGNAAEFVDYSERMGDANSPREICGGWFDEPSDLLNINGNTSDSYMSGYAAPPADPYYGFRVAGYVPEPGSITLLVVGGALSLLAYAWRKRRI